MPKVSIPLTAIILVAILVAAAIAGTAVYYNVLVNDRNQQIASLNQQITKDNNQIANLTVQFNDLKNSTSSSEKLTLSNFSNSWEGVVGSGIWDWNMSFDITNNGNATAIINNIIIDGQSYNTLKPAPAISPSIVNGYALLPNQTVSIFINETKTAFMPFHSGGVLYVATAIGNTYSLNIGESS